MPLIIFNDFEDRIDIDCRALEYLKKPACMRDQNSSDLAGRIFAQVCDINFSYSTPSKSERLRHTNWISCWSRAYIELMNKMVIVKTFI